MPKQVLPLHSFARFVPANSQRLAAGTYGTAPSTMKLQASKAPAPIGKKIEAPPTTLREGRPTKAVFSFVAELNLHNLLTLGRNQTSLDLLSLNRRFPPRPAPRTQGHPRPEMSIGVFVNSRLVFPLLLPGHFDVYTACR